DRQRTPGRGAGDGDRNRLRRPVTAPVTPDGTTARGAATGDHEHRGLRRLPGRSRGPVVSSRRIGLTSPRGGKYGSPSWGSSSPVDPTTRSAAPAATPLETQPER